MKEVVQLINASSGWRSYGKGCETVEFKATLLPEVQDDPIPIVVVTYYPACDCGELNLVSKVLLCEEFDLYGYGYMDTCYECAVVSSD
jgi:hypothetical protein